MSLVVLLILGIVWAVFLVPQVVRWRAEQTATDSVGAFRDQISVLRRTSPYAPPAANAVTGPVMRPAVGTKAMARKRRRDILAGLFAGMVASLLVGVVTDTSAILWLHATLDVVFVTYIVALARARTVAAERELKVRYLPGRQGDLRAFYGPADPALLLRRSGS